MLITVQADSVVSDTNWFINPLLPSWQHEERDTIPTMLTPPRRAANFVVFKISVDRASKNNNIFQRTKTNSASTVENSTLALMVQSRLTSFQNPQILRTISSGHDVIPTPAPFLVWRFIMTIVIAIAFACECKLHQMTMHLNLRDSNTSKPNQNEW